MKPNFLIVLSILFCCVLDASAAGMDACGGCHESQICRSSTLPSGIRMNECVVAEPKSPSNDSETPKAPSAPKTSCDESNCPPPKMCMTDDWGGNDYYCVESKYSNPPAVDTSPGGSACAAEFHSFLDSCRLESQGAVNSCDEKQDQGVSSVSSQASQLAIMMGQMAASSIQAACSKMANLSQAANAAIAAYQLSCSSAINSCKSTCSEGKNFVKQNALCLAGGVSTNQAAVAESMTAALDHEIQKCNGLTANVAAANQAIQNYIGTSANASQCAALNDGTGVVLPEICKTDPKNPICVKPGEVDCSKPEMATNKVCVCSRNPFDPVCSSVQKVGGGLGAGNGGGIDSSSRLMSKADSGRTGDIPSLPELEQGEFKKSDGVAGPDAEKVGNGGISGGGSGAGSGGGRGAGGGSSGGDAEPSKVVSGFYGGGSGSGGFGSNGYRGGGGNGGYVPNAGAIPGKGNPPPDLRQFLPGGQYDPKRMISGISGPDGITGPHSNIWQKVQNRYEIVRPSLLP